MKEVDNINRSTTRVVLAVLAFLGFSAAGAFAEKFGPFTYRVVDGTIDIIDYTGDDTGHVDIPAEIDGKPVTAITGGRVEPMERSFPLESFQSLSPKGWRPSGVLLLESASISPRLSFPTP